MATTFDVKEFASLIVQPLREVLAAALTRSTDEVFAIKRMLEELEGDVAATLTALEMAPNDRIRKLLRDDLEKFLPARRDALLALLATQASSDVQAAAQAALEVVVRAAVSVAKAFIVVA